MTSFLSALLLSLSAFSEEWPPVLQTQAIVCDTQKQAESIIEATRDEGLEAGKAAYMAFNVVKNDEEEPTCGIGNVLAFLEDEVAVYRNLRIGVVSFNAYVLSFRTPQRPQKVYYLIFLKAVKDNGV